MMENSVRYSRLCPDRSSAVCGLLEFGSMKILLDAGWEEPFRPGDLKRVREVCKDVNLVVVTEGTLRCCAALPYLRRWCGLSAPVFMTDDAAQSALLCVTSARATLLHHWGALQSAEDLLVHRSVMAASALEEGDVRAADVAPAIGAASTAIPAWRAAQFPFSGRDIRSAFDFFSESGARNRRGYRIGDRISVKRGVDLELKPLAGGAVAADAAIWSIVNGADTVLYAADVGASAVSAAGTMGHPSVLVVDGGRGTSRAPVGVPAEAFSRIRNAMLQRGDVLIPTCAGAGARTMIALLATKSGIRFGAGPAAPQLVYVSPVARQTCEMLPRDVAAACTPASSLAELDAARRPGTSACIIADGESLETGSPALCVFARICGKISSLVMFFSRGSFGSLARRIVDNVGNTSPFETIQEFTERRRSDAEREALAGAADQSAAAYQGGAAAADGPAGAMADDDQPTQSVPGAGGDALQQQQQQQQSATQEGPAPMKDDDDDDEIFMPSMLGGSGSFFMQSGDPEEKNLLAEHDDVIVNNPDVPVLYPFSEEALDFDAFGNAVDVRQLQRLASAAAAERRMGLDGGGAPGEGADGGEYERAAERDAEEQRQIDLDDQATEYGVASRRVDVKCRLVYENLDGRCDSEGLREFCTRVAPQSIAILCGGSTEGLQGAEILRVGLVGSLGGRMRACAVVTEDKPFFAERQLLFLNASLSGAALEEINSRKDVRNRKEQGDYQVAQVTLDCTADGAQNISLASTDWEAASLNDVPSTAFIGTVSKDRLLAALRDRQFAVLDAGNTIVVNNGKVLLRLNGGSSSDSRMDITIEGQISETLFEVRKLVYGCF